MGNGYKAKVFKSGNSLALRLPKALGIEEGSEMVLREMPTGYAFEPVETPKRTIDISGFAGKLPGFKPAPREDFEERPSTIARRKALSGE
jgi:antitoxin VapB